MRKISKYNYIFFLTNIAIDNEIAIILSFKKLFLNLIHIYTHTYTLLHTPFYLPSNAFHHQLSHRGNCPSLGVVEGALGVVQTGQRSDLLLRDGGPVRRLKEGEMGK